MSNPKPIVYKKIKTEATGNYRFDPSSRAHQELPSLKVAGAGK